MVLGDTRRCDDVYPSKRPLQERIERSPRVMSTTPLRIGTLTIGQAPRNDLLPLMPQYASSRVTFYHKGALDGLTHAAITRHFGARGDTLLTTRCLDGSCVRVSHSAIEEALKTKLRELEALRCKIIFLFSNASFRRLQPRYARLIQPKDVLPHWAYQTLGQQKVGILATAPAAPQSTFIQGRHAPLNATFSYANPYFDSHETFLTQAQRLVDAGAQAIFLDGLGYLYQHRRWCLEVAHCPIYTSVALLTDFIEVAVPTWLKLGHRVPVEWPMVEDELS